MPEEKQSRQQKPPGEPAEEKLEFLQREEVRTMAKDLAKVREREAGKEREKIAGTQAKPNVVLSQEPSHQQKAPPAPEPKLPFVPRRALTPSQKLFVRLVAGAVVLFLAFNAVAFGFWYFFQRGDALQEQTRALAPAPVPVPAPAPESVPEPAPLAPPVPASFFKAPEKEIAIKEPAELLGALQTFLQEDLNPGFLHLVAKQGENLLSENQFLEGTAIAMPQELKDTLSGDIMLFSYTAEGKKRLGMALELQETSGAPEQLLAWEATLEEDTRAFFDIVGRKGTAYTPVFRSAVYLRIPVRFQTFSVIDFGIVYGMVGDKLVLTSSFESFQRTADLLLVQ